ncbi:MAG TPA: DegV family protein [Dehalococcoidia bacterium]|nr:DegV family protein [Dehalococcoidia bacterium]
MSIRIVTDSTADLPAGLAAERRITVVPLTVMFGDNSFLDGVDIDTAEFFHRLPDEPQPPTTSQPSPAAFREIYERLAAEGATEILSIHVSEKVSGTLNSARQGAEGLDVRVVHVDSQVTSMALGLGVLAAADAIDDGTSLDEAKVLAEDLFARTHIFIIVETLEYLRRGGRIGRAGHLFGSLLKITPVLTFEDGEVAPLAKARTQSKAIAAGLKLAEAQAPFQLAAAMHTNSPDGADAIAARLREIQPDVSIITSTLGPAVGTHCGPGTLAFAVISSPSPDG